MAAPAAMTPAELERIIKTTTIAERLADTSNIARSM
jgi:hypothetical protein